MFSPGGQDDGFSQAVHAFVWGLTPPPESTDQVLASVGLPDPPIIRTPDDLEAFIWNTFRLRISKSTACRDQGVPGHEHHCSPWDAFCYAYFATGPICLWKASRGFGGKSFMLSLLVTVEGITLKADVKVLGGSEDQSVNVLKYSKGLWEAGDDLQQFLKTEPGTTETTLIWGNTIHALPASMKAVRGPHPQRLRLDEFDETKLAIIEAAQGQPMSKGWVQSQTVLSSTHHYPNGPYTEMKRRAADRGWPIFEWCYRENMVSNGGWLADEEVTRKQVEIGSRMWAVEYEGQEPSAEGRAFDSQAVIDMFRKPDEVAILARHPDGRIDYGTDPIGYLEPPVDGGSYCHGADWAKKTDHTVQHTLRRDSRPLKLVATRRTQKEPWPTMVGYLNERVTAYGGSGLHDETGIGNVVEDYLNAPGMAGFIMVGRDRADLLTEYVAGVERHEIVCPWPDPLDDSAEARAIRVMKDEHLYATVDDLYGSGGKAHLPDTVAAGALAYRAATTPEPASAVEDPPDSPLQRIQAGRMSGLMGLRRRRPE